MSAKVKPNLDEGKVTIVRIRDTTYKCVYWKLELESWDFGDDGANDKVQLNFSQYSDGNEYLATLTTRRIDGFKDKIFGVLGEDQTEDIYFNIKNKDSVKGVEVIAKINVKSFYDTEESPYGDCTPHAVINYDSLEPISTGSPDESFTISVANSSNGGYYFLKIGNCKDNLGSKSIPGITPCKVGVGEEGCLKIKYILVNEKSSGCDNNMRDSGLIPVEGQAIQIYMKSKILFPQCYKIESKLTPPGLEFDQINAKKQTCCGQLEGGRHNPDSECINLSSSLVHRPPLGLSCDKCAVADPIFLKNHVYGTLITKSWREGVGIFEEGVDIIQAGPEGEIINIALSKVRGVGHTTVRKEFLPGAASSARFYGESGWNPQDYVSVNGTSFFAMFEAVANQSIQFAQKWKQVMFSTADPFRPDLNPVTGDIIYKDTFSRPEKIKEYVEMLYAHAASIQAGVRGKQFEVGISITGTTEAIDGKQHVDDNGNFTEFKTTVTEVSATAWFELDDLIKGLIDKDGFNDSIKDKLHIRFNFGKAREEHNYLYSTLIKDKNKVESLFKEKNPDFKDPDKPSDPLPLAELFTIQSINVNWDISTVNGSGIILEAAVKNGKISPILFGHWNFEPVEKIICNLSANSLGEASLGISFLPDYKLLDVSVFKDDKGNELKLNSYIDCGIAITGSQRKSYGPSLGFHGSLKSFGEESHILSGLSYDVNVIQGKIALSKYEQLLSSQNFNVNYVIEAQVGDPTRPIFTAKIDALFEKTIIDFGGIWGKLIFRGGAILSLKLGGMLDSTGGMTTGGTSARLAVGTYLAWENKILGWFGFPINVFPTIGFGLSFGYEAGAGSSLGTTSAAEFSHSFSMGVITFNYSKVDLLREHLQHQHISFFSNFGFLGCFFKDLPILNKIGKEESIFRYLVRASIIRGYLGILEAVWRCKRGEHDYVDGIIKTKKPMFKKVLDWNKKLEKLKTRFKDDWEKTKDYKDLKKNQPKDYDEITKELIEFGILNDDFLKEETKLEKYTEAQIKIYRKRLNPCKCAQNAYRSVTSDKNWSSLDYKKYPELAGPDGLISAVIDLVDQFVFDYYFEGSETFDKFFNNNALGDFLYKYLTPNNFSDNTKLIAANGGRVINAAELDSIKLEIQTSMAKLLKIKIESEKKGEKFWKSILDIFFEQKHCDISVASLLDKFLGEGGKLQEFKAGCKINFDVDDPERYDNACQLAYFNWFFVQRFWGLDSTISDIPGNLLSMPGESNSLPEAAELSSGFLHYLSSTGLIEGNSVYVANDKCEKRPALYIGSRVVPNIYGDPDYVAFDVKTFFNNYNFLYKNTRFPKDLYTIKDQLLKANLDFYGKKEFCKGFPLFYPTEKSLKDCGINCAGGEMYEPDLNRQAFNETNYTKASKSIGSTPITDADAFFKLLALQGQYRLQLSRITTLIKVYENSRGPSFELIKYYFPVCFDGNSYNKIIKYYKGHDGKEMTVNYSAQFIVNQFDPKEEIILEATDIYNAIYQTPTANKSQFDFVNPVSHFDKLKAYYTKLLRLDLPTNDNGFGKAVKDDFLAGANVLSQFLRHWLEMYISSFEFTGATKREEIYDFHKGMKEKTNEERETHYKNKLDGVPFYWLFYGGIENIFSIQSDTIQSLHSIYSNKSMNEGDDKNLFRYSIEEKDCYNVTLGSMHPYFTLRGSGGSDLPSNIYLTNLCFLYQDPTPLESKFKDGIRVKSITNSLTNIKRGALRFPVTRGTAPKK